MTHKDLIAKRFIKSSVNYNQNALVQKEMADSLIDLLINQSGSQYNIILEIGCGTGLLTQNIHKKLIFNQLFVNDLNESYKKYITQLNIKAEFISGDAETTAFSNELDLIVSNAVFQWFENLDQMIYKCFNLLKPGGILAFSTFGTKNYLEISSTAGFSLNYYQLNELKKKLEKYFKVLDVKQEIRKLSFNNPMQVLKHIHLTGVNGNSHEIWSRSDFEKFTNLYENFKEINGSYPLTYEPYYFILKKEDKCR